MAHCLGNITEVGRRKKRKTSIAELSLGKIKPDMNTPSYVSEGWTRGRNRRNFQEEGDIKARVLKH